MSVVVKIMPEYECYPIWISKNEGIFENIKPSELKISDALKRQIENWDSKFENTYDRKNPINSGFKNENEISVFEKEGFFIWANLAKELTEFKIVYRSLKNEKEYVSPFDYALELMGNIP
jgi:hypothetical protein